MAERDASSHDDSDGASAASDGPVLAGLNKKSRVLVLEIPGEMVRCERFAVLLLLTIPAIPAPLCVNASSPVLVGIWINQKERTSG